MLATGKNISPPNSTGIVTSWLDPAASGFVWPQPEQITR
jgi:hypothetical protein